MEGTCVCTRVWIVHKVSRQASVQNELLLVGSSSEGQLFENCLKLLKLAVAMFVILYYKFFTFATSSRIVLRTCTQERGNTAICELHLCEEYAADHHLHVTD